MDVRSVAYTRLMHAQLEELNRLTEGLHSMRARARNIDSGAAELRDGLPQLLEEALLAISRWAGTVEARLAEESSDTL